MARRRLLSFVLLVPLALGGVPSSKGAAVSAASVARPSLNVQASRYGAILFDGRGYVLYAFTRDARGRPSCYGPCARRWPPYLVKSRPSAGPGANASFVGVIRRRDGRLQATYAGRPLYYYVGDTAPRLILCQSVSEFGRIWLVVRGSGKPVR